MGLEQETVLQFVRTLENFASNCFLLNFFCRLLKVAEIKKMLKVLSCLQPKSDLLKGFIDQNTTVPEDVLPSKSQGPSPVLKE